MSDSTDIGTASTLPVNIKIPGYRLRRQAGSDSIGLWFDVEQESLGRKLTLRILKPKYEQHEEARRELLAEMDRLTQLDHPHLPRVIDTVREGMLVMVTERLGARNLETLLRPGRSLGLGTSLQLALELTRALDYLTGKGFAHKNLTPGLITVRDPGGCRLVTFRNVITMEELAALRGKLAQDAHYVAPEQLAGDDPIGPAAHVYHVGALLYHMLAGRPPHGPGDVREVARAHLTQDFPSVKRFQPFLKRGVYDFIAACTRRAPDTRPDLGVVETALERLLEGHDPELPDAPGARKIVAPRPRRRRRRRH
ncbi:MAG: serine/threonine protein kinase [Planctomycetota bacterium]